MFEKQEECVICFVGGNLTRVPQIPSITSNEKQQPKAGDMTKDFIERNRDLLKSMKEEAKRVTYED
tara:strand:+ start:1537 stop:1734 length:198 start_codon:yes stop_codon:yes gene_type:complete